VELKELAVARFSDRRKNADARSVPAADATALHVDDGLLANAGEHGPIGHRISDSRRLGADKLGRKLLIDFG
jgi:hypothetical protein